MKNTKNRAGKTSTSGKSGSPAARGDKKKFTVDETRLAKIAGGLATSTGTGAPGRLSAN